MKTTLSIAALLIAMPALALADGAAQPAPTGADTRALLELQRGGQAASTTERPMSGEVAKRAHQRYVDSFSQPIPKSLSEEEQAFVKDKK